jgi:hypothetical protein
MLLDESAFNAGGNGFALSSNGETIYLTMGNANGPTHFVDSVSFGDTMAGETYGRILETDWFAPMSKATLGKRNSDPRVGPVVISEVQRDPGTPSAAALAIYPNLNSGDLEFIEIHNPQASQVDLNNWRIRGGVDITFGADTLGPGETLVVVSFAADRSDNVDRTAAFRAHYGLGENVKIVGGYANQLNNDRDRVTLQRPGMPAADGSIPRLLEDEVVYSNVGDWESEAGNSIHRTAKMAFGNDPLNWVSATPTPGTVDYTSGDVNADGAVDADDVQVVCSAIMTDGNPAFDYTRDGVLTFADFEYFIRRVVGTTFGDANVDGTFNSTDLTLIFQTNQYEDSIPGNSTWATGDWNCDGEFTTRDIVTAFMYGRYEQSVAAVSTSHIAGAIDQVDALNLSTGNVAQSELRVDTGRSNRPAIQLQERSVDSVFADHDTSIAEGHNDRDTFDDSDLDERNWQTGLI